MLAVRNRGDGREEITQRRCGGTIDSQDNGAFAHTRLVEHVAWVGDVHASHWDTVVARLLIAEFIECSAAHLRRCKRGDMVGTQVRH
eukprot:scaffold150935_cov32-Tisochrysis_lutea.AAC.3